MCANDARRRAAGPISHNSRGCKEPHPGQTELIAMTCPRRFPSLLPAILALGCATAGWAQTPVSPAASPTPVVEPASGAPAATPDPTPAKPKRARVMSNEVAASLAPWMPKYNPPKPVEPKADEDADARDIDRPKNGIVRLPKYVVTEPKPPVFRDRDLHTKEEMTDIGLRRNRGLSLGNIGGFNQPIALMMYQEQERLDNMADLKDDAKTAKRSGDSASADYISRETARTYYRPSDFGWNSDNPAGK